MIEPDTKDWTWVLSEPCPECGFEAAAVDRRTFGDRIRDDALGWPAVLSLPEASRRPVPSTRSPLEYACHVRDVFRLYDERLALMLTQDDPRFANWDQDATAVEERYGEQDPLTVAGELHDAGQRIADRFAGVTGEQWQRTGSRSDGARFTVDTFSRYLLHDPVHHLHDVGRPG